VTWELIFVLTNYQNASNAAACFEIFKKISRAPVGHTGPLAKDRLIHKTISFGRSFIL